MREYFPKLVAALLFLTILLLLVTMHQELQVYYQTHLSTSNFTIQLAHKSWKFVVAWYSAPQISLTLQGALLFTASYFLLLVHGTHLLVTAVGFFILIYMTGCDVIIAASLFSMTLFRYSLQKCYSHSSFRSCLALTGISTLASLCSMQLSPFIALLCFITFSNPATNHQDDSLYGKLALPLYFLPSLVCASFAFAPQFSDVPFFPEHVPLASSYSPQYTIDRTAIRFFWGDLAKTLLCFSVPLLLFSQVRKSGRQFALIFSMSSLCLFADTVLPEQVSQVAPLQSISRLFPGLYFFPLAPYCFSFLIFLLLTASIHASRTRNYLLSTVLLSLLIVEGILIQSTQVPLALAYTRLLDSTCTSHPLSTSSSLRLIKDHNLDYLCSQPNVEKTLYRHDMAAVTTSIPTKERRTERLRDGKRDTRWSTKQPQQGNEWIEMHFHTAISLGGIELLQGKWPKETPKKIEISLSKSCAGNDFQIIFTDENTTHQRIHMSAQGYPYVARNDSFSSVWPLQDNIRCLRIRQIAAATQPWSVAGIVLLTTTERQARY